MQEKLIKLLTIKIGATNKNIDNLNYLNEELQVNKQDLSYLEHILELFNTDENTILNLDKIEKEDFDKVLEMIDNKVKTAFLEKTCNYQGIMYIIQGIRQGISLELTKEQEEAINLLIDNIKIKNSLLIETIERLEESKNRLPETNLEVLNKDLEVINNIINNLQNGKYLTEIEEVLVALEFAGISLEEKNDIFAYILKYNRDIYETKKEVLEEKTNDFVTFPEVNVVDKTDLEQGYQIPIKEEINEEVTKEEITPIQEDKFDQTSTIDLQEIIKKIDEKLKEIETNKELTDETLEEIPEELDNNEELAVLDEKENFDNEIKDLDKEKIEEFKPATIEPENVLESINLDEFKLPTFEPSTLNIEPTIPVTPLVTTPDVSDLTSDLNKPSFPQNTFENEELKEEIKDEEIKEEVKEEKSEEIKNNILIDEVVKPLNAQVEPLPVIEEEINLSNPETTSKSELIEFLNKNDLIDYETEFLNSFVDVNELSNNLNILIENKVLEVFKEQKAIFSKTLLNNNPDNLIELFNLIKNEYALNDKNYQDILPYFIVTLPIIFVNQDVQKVFIANTEYFKSLKINLINLFDNYRELLIIDTNTLKDNYAKVSKYGLVLTNDNVKYLLANKNVLQEIDYYLEANAYEKGFLGRENVFDGLEYITKHPYKIANVNYDVLLKLRYATDNNLKIYGNKPGILAGEITNPKVDLLNIQDEYKNLYFNNEYGFIDRSELSNLLMSIKEDDAFDLTADENIILLDNLYKISDLRYEIENLYFSRLKTIRIYNILKNKNINTKQALLIALTYNSVIKHSEYLKIEQIVNNLKGGN